MRPQDIISRKRDGGALSEEEIKYFVGGVTDGSFAEYQSAALLMAIFLRGMNEGEQFALTDAMLHSGSSLDFSEIAKPKADKHSTGGVGDKTSLLIAPLAAACGVCVPMISGRGLGHTGGTLDKLESIPGYRVRLSTEEAHEILHRVGFAMMGQTAEIAPADRKLYALRDATATVEAIPLIVASIMSKKLAAGLGALVLDVKSGTGAFMHDEAHARELAHALVKTGRAFGVRTEALLTDMNQPLGRAVGHAVEVVECIEILRGEVDDRARAVRDLSVELSARMVFLSNIETSIEAARTRVLRALESGEGLECLRRNVEAQGGDARACDDPRGVLQTSPLREVAVESTRTGFIKAIDAAEIGLALASIGGGRVRVEDKIDPLVGYFADAKLGEELREGQTLGTLLCRDETQEQQAAPRILKAYTIGDEPPHADSHKLIKDVISE
ncbi:MAG: pyrimidine-nucleoside phosphorylase [Acidobacteriota bacterium]|nr:pyrimidine-nucleoside phosphorylase [Acidobacteriota bacterium]